jgi:SAM-dependent methyltransferase
MKADLPQPETRDDARAGAVVDAWTAYWQAGSTGSCFVGSAAAMGLARFWTRLADELPNNARVLDLATGNGTVAKAIATRARLRGVRFGIDAVDSARIDPPAHVEDPDRLLGDVRFHGSTALEALPFANSTFNCVVSQFGFEYADEAAAAQEAARVLAPDGRLRLILHARDGAVTRDTARRLERLRLVLGTNGAVGLVCALVRAAAARDSSRLRELSARLPGAAEQARRLAQNPPAEDAALFYASEFLRAWARRDHCRFEDLQRSVEDGWRNANGVAVRQEQMQVVARSADEVAEIAARFAGAGLDVEKARPIRDDRRAVQIAWLVDARKP